MQIRALLLIVLCFIMASCQSLPVDFDSAKLGTIERDITYCTMNGVPLKMDVYYPSTRQAQWAVIIHIHGGGWISGSKGIDEIVNPEALRKSGILLATVDYRLAPEHKFPAMIEDVKCAVRYLRAHASEYNIDPLRFGAIGSSAGGHLAALLGLTDAAAGFDVGEYLKYPSNVQAVVDLYGPANLAPPHTRRLFFDRMEVFGTYDQHDPIFLRASPVYYADTASPPFLIIQGQFDTTVPPLQSRLLFESLQRKGVPAEMIIVKNAGHNLLPVEGQTIQPSIEELREKIMEFWMAHLKK